MILLDTNVCVGFLRGNANVIAAYKRNAGNVAISAMTVGELFFGVGNSNPEFVEKNKIDLMDLSFFDIERVEEFADKTQAYPFDEYDDAFYNMEPIETYLKNISETT